MLLQSIQEIKAVLPVGAGNDFNRLRPHLQNAQSAFILPLLGKSMYEELKAFYASLPLTGELTPEQQSMSELLRKVQFATVHLAFFMGFDFLSVSVSDMGFNRMESDRTKSLFKYQEDNLKEYFKTAGFNALDDILVYLEDNIGYFEGFKASPGWTVFRQMFIPTARIFNEICFINNSRLTFLRMRSHMAYVESMEVLPILGKEAFDLIKSEMVKDAPLEKVKAILPLIRQAIAWLSSAMLMEESGADLTERGLYFTSTMQNFFENHKVTPSDPGRIALLVLRNRQIGQSYLLAIRSHLAAHPEDWPMVTLSTESWRNRDNTGKKTFWV